MALVLYLGLACTLLGYVAWNATRILDSWGLMDQVKAVGCLPENLVMRDAITGEELRQNWLVL